MAKGKSTSAAKSAAPARSKPKAPKSQNSGSPGPAKKSAGSAQRELTSDEIGHVAGEVWALLHSHGEQTLAAIKKSIAAPPDIIVAALGWLAREGKLNFQVDGRAVIVALR
jgi:hypothetical protein